VLAKIHYNPEAFIAMFIAVVCWNWQRCILYNKLAFIFSVQELP